MKTIVILYSYHHNNTEKVAKVIAKVLEAEIKRPKELKPSDLTDYDLIGFGSGIYSEQHHGSMIKLVKESEKVKGKKAFIFSTSGVPMIGWTEEKVAKDHEAMRKTLEDRGFEVVGEFGCLGWNTNSFTKYFGGINKGHPDAKDLENAQDFAKRLKAEKHHQEDQDV